MWILRLFGPSFKSVLPLIGNVIKTLAKSVLIPLGLTSATSAKHVAIHKKMFGPGATSLITSIKEMNDIMKIVKSLEQSGLLLKYVTETMKNEAKEQKEGFCGTSLGTLGASLLQNLLTVNWAVEGTVRAGQ